MVVNYDIPYLNKFILSKRCCAAEYVQAGSDSLRDNLERIIGVDDSKFNGADLAALIRKKYGRSYDVQLIKKVPLIPEPGFFLVRF